MHASEAIARKLQISWFVGDQSVESHQSAHIQTPKQQRRLAISTTRCSSDHCEHTHKELISETWESTEVQLCSAHRTLTVSEAQRLGREYIARKTEIACRRHHRSWKKLVWESPKPIFLWLSHRVRVFFFNYCSALETPFQAQFPKACVPFKASPLINFFFSHSSLAPILSTTFLWHVFHVKQHARETKLAETESPKCRVPFL